MGVLAFDFLALRGFVPEFVWIGACEAFPWTFEGGVGGKPVAWPLTSTGEPSGERYSTAGTEVLCSGWMVAGRIDCIGVRCRGLPYLTASLVCRPSMLQCAGRLPTREE
jgi:hypothetical protein